LLQFIAILEAYYYVKFVGLLEFKFIKREDKAPKKLIEKLKLEAKEQLNKYEDDTLVTTHTNNGVKLKKVMLVFHGWEMVCCEVLE